MMSGVAHGRRVKGESPFAAIAGTYRLATVNGDELSVPWETDGVFANYFTGAEIELKADGTFTRTIRGRTVIPQMNDIFHNESWSGSYTFQPSAPGEDNGEITLHVNSLSNSNGSQLQLVLVYVRD